MFQAVAVAKPVFQKRFGILSLSDTIYSAFSRRISGMHLAKHNGTRSTHDDTRATADLGGAIRERLAAADGRTAMREARLRHGTVVGARRSEPTDTVPNPGRPLGSHADARLQANISKFKVRKKRD